eukprot:2615641-Amphidinium_carterae.1
MPQAKAGCCSMATARTPCWCSSLHGVHLTRAWSKQGDEPLARSNPHGPVFHQATFSKFVPCPAARKVL